MKKWHFNLAIDKSIVVLCLPLFFLAFADYLFTATRQPPPYYSAPTIEERVVNNVKIIEMKKSAEVREENEIGKWLLERHILLFVTYSILWFPLILLAMHVIPEALHKVFKISPHILRGLYLVIDVIYLRIDAVWSWFSEILKGYFVNFPPATIASIIKTSHLLFVLIFCAFTIWAIIKYCKMQFDNK